MVALHVPIYRYLFKDGAITRLSKFEVELPAPVNQLSPKLLERDVYLAPIYQRLCVMPWPPGMLMRHGDQEDEEDGRKMKERKREREREREMTGMRKRRIRVCVCVARQLLLWRSRVKDRLFMVNPHLRDVPWSS